MQQAQQARHVVHIDLPISAIHIYTYTHIGSPERITKEIPILSYINVHHVHVLHTFP